MLSQVNLTTSTISPGEEYRYNFRAGGKSLTQSVTSIYTDQLQMLLSKCPDWFLKKSWRPYLDHLLKINGQQIVIDCKLRMKLVLSTKMGG